MINIKLFCLNLFSAMLLPAPEIFSRSLVSHSEEFGGKSVLLS